MNCAFLHCPCGFHQMHSRRSSELDNERVISKFLLPAACIHSMHIAHAMLYFYVLLYVPTPTSALAQALHAAAESCVATTQFSEQVETSELSDCALHEK